LGFNFSRVIENALVNVIACTSSFGWFGAWVNSDFTDIDFQWLGGG
jgi:hypothetical protein